MGPKFTRRQMAAALAPAVPSRAAEARPNILLMLSDDHSVPYLACYGFPVQTPNFDRFVRQAMRFDRAFTAAPQCVPSRAAMLTGRSPAAARIARFSSPLAPDVATLPELLRAQAGYYTGICRRNFHLDGPGKAGPVTEPIFQKYDMRTFHKRVDFLDRNSGRNQTVPKINEFLDQVPKGRPFFLWMNTSDPHHVWDAPRRHDPATLPLPAHLPDLPGMRDDLARYCDEVARLDEEFQWVLDTLERRGHADHTLILFIGDNGMAFPHGKGSLYDPGLNVPLLVRWPGRVKGGSSTAELVSGEDITPTLLAAAGLRPLKEMTGRSFLPLLRGEAHQSRAYIFAQRGVHGQTAYREGVRSSGWDLSRCVRSRRFKLIYNCTPWQQYSPVDSARDPGWRETVAAHEAGRLDPKLDRAYFTHPRPVFELFDLQEDPSELNNLAARADHAEVLRELQIALQEKMIVDYDFLPLPLNE